MHLEIIEKAEFKLEVDGKQILDFDQTPKQEILIYVFM